MKRIKSLIFLILFSLVLFSCRRNPKEGAAIDTPVPFSLTVYDALKGDAFLISCGDFNMMIDCGYKKTAPIILSDLKDRNIKSIDLLIISHFDKDHVGGAPKILKGIKVKRIVTTRKTNNDKRTEKFFEALSETGLKNEVCESDIDIEVPGLKISIRPPERKKYQDSEDNNSSLFVRTESPYGTLLFTGDAESERMDEILSYKDLDCDLIKIPHHGREVYGLQELLDISTPETAVITSSLEEPSDIEVLRIIKQHGVRYYETAEYGTFELTFDEKGIRKK